MGARIEINLAFVQMKLQAASRYSTTPFSSDTLSTTTTPGYVWISGRKVK